MGNLNQKSEDRNQKLVSTKYVFFSFILNPKRIVFMTLAALVFTAFLVVNTQTKVSAATGINPTVNFQGKVVNSDGTNVADGKYTFVFKLYDADTSGTNLWTETQNNVQVTGGIFRVSLGSVQSLSGIDFNSDSLYLGINFNSDGEMTPRIRFASVPYAFNAKKVAGLTVTDTTGTLTIPNSKTVAFGGAFTTDGNDISFTTSGTTTLALPATGTLATLGGIENLSNKTFTTTITTSGVATDFTTGTNENLTIAPNGTGNVLINPSAGGSAALILDKKGLGDIFAASSSGITKFVIQSDGTASSSAGFTINGVGGLQSTNNQTLTVGGGPTGDLVIGHASQTTYFAGFANCTLKTTIGGLLSCGVDNTGTGGGGDNFWQYDATKGIIAPGNLTVATLFGGTASNSALMTIAGTANSGTVPVASISAHTSYAGLVVDNTTGDLFTASSSGQTRFVINQNGYVGIGKSIALASLDIKDLSSVASQGSEKITNSNDSTFTSDTGDWTTFGSPAWKINVASSGKAAKDAPGTGAITLSNSFLGSAPVAGNTYRVTFDYTTTSSSSGSLTMSFGGASGYPIGTSTFENQPNQVQVIVTANTNPLTFTPTIDWYGTIDNVFVEQMTTSSVALRLEASDGSTNPLEIRTGGDSLTSMFIGNGSGRINTAGIDNVAVGYQALYDNTTGSYNTANGYVALSNNTTGSYNTANGVSALYSNTTGSYNTANGYFALYQNTTGFYNTANGYEALFNNTTGDSNVANGFVALQFNKTGSNNTANGYYALRSNAAGNNNTATGGWALTNATGSYNTANGFGALEFNSTGYSNTANGYNTGLTNTVGGSNSFLGAYSDVGSGNLINATAIGANALVASNDSLVLGSIYGVNSATGSAKIGIGTTAPKFTLDVNGGYGSNALVSLNQKNLGDLFTASSSGTTKFTIKNDGTASTSGGLTFDGGGAIQSTKNQNLTIGGDSTGNITFSPKNGLGSVTIGTSTNGLVFDTVNGGPTYAGTARPTKTITLSPEYAGAVLTPFYGAGTDTSITGSMTSDTDTTVGTSIRNYYQWLSTSGSQQFYTVAVRVTLPQDFSGWATSNAVVVNYITQNASTATSTVETRIYRDGSATLVASSTGASTTWNTQSWGASSLTNWNTADQTAVIYLRLGSTSSNYARVGDIKLNYLSKF